MGLGPRVTAPAWLRAALSMDPHLPCSCVSPGLQGMSPDPDPRLPQCPAVQGDLQRGGRWVTWVPGGSQRVPELEPEPERLPCVEGEGR
jgi:hypothetical protein